MARAIGHAKLAELQEPAAILKAFARNCCQPQQVSGTGRLSVERRGVNERQHRNGRCDSGPPECGHEFLPMRKYAGVAQKFRDVHLRTWRQEFLSALTG